MGDKNIMTTLDPRELTTESSRPYRDASDEELDELFQSITHSIIGGSASISFWNDELTNIRRERKLRQQEQSERLTDSEAS